MTQKKKIGYSAAFGLFISLFFNLYFNWRDLKDFIEPTALIRYEYYISDELWARLIVLTIIIIAGTIYTISSYRKEAVIFMDPSSKWKHRIQMVILTILFSILFFFLFLFPLAIGLRPSTRPIKGG